MTAGDPIYWTWVRIVRRAELGFGVGKKRVGSDTVQHVALIAVTYGNPDGTRIRPSVARLARVCRKDEKTVRLCLARLREVGLLVRVFEGSSAGRSAKADEYRLAIPADLMDRIAMLDPDERTLVVPEGVEPPAAKRARADKSPSSALGSPGAAPADKPVDKSSSPGAAPADPELLDGNHRVLPPGTPGAAPKNTGCSTRPPTHRPPKDLPHTFISPYGAEVEGGTAARREPSAEISRPTYRQPPLIAALPNPEPDQTDYARARDALAALPEFGNDLIQRARQELGADTPRPQLIIHAADLARRTA